MFSLALISATSNLRNISASSVLQNSPSHLESGSSRYSSPPSTGCSRPDRSDDPLLVGCTRILDWDVTNEGGKDLTVHLFLGPFESPHPSFGTGLGELPVSPDPLVPSGWRVFSVARPCSSPTLGNDLVELFPVRCGVQNGLGCGHDGTCHMTKRAERLMV